MKQKDFEEGKRQEKYLSRNPISNFLVAGFFDGLSLFFDDIPVDKVASVIEVGVGEGQVTEIAVGRFPDASFVSVDIAEGILDVARQNLGAYSNISYEIQDVHRLPYQDGSFDVVICCEVLEHVDDPHQALRELGRILRSGGYAILTVPNEPLWRIMNVCRFKYWSDLGNTPGHVNHWSKTSFTQFVSREFALERTLSPTPWTFVLSRKDITL